MKVLISRSPSEWRKAEYDVDKIKDVEWSNIVGGLQVPQARGYSLYGKIPYKDAMGLVACSGEHNYGNNMAKICIPDKYNSRGEYKEGYEYLILEKAKNIRPKYQSFRSEEEEKCANIIQEIVSKQGEIARGKLRTYIKKTHGYEAKIISKSLEHLKYQRKIKIIKKQGSNSQIITKFTYQNMQ